METTTPKRVLKQTFGINTPQFHRLPIAVRRQVEEYLQGKQDPDREMKLYNRIRRALKGKDRRPKPTRKAFRDVDEGLDLLTEETPQERETRLEQKLVTDAETHIQDLTPAERVAYRRGILPHAYAVFEAAGIQNLDTMVQLYNRTQGAAVHELAMVNRGILQSPGGTYDIRAAFQSEGKYDVSKAVFAYMAAVNGACSSVIGAQEIGAVLGYCGPIEKLEEDEEEQDSPLATIIVMAMDDRQLEKELRWPLSFSDQEITDIVASSDGVRPAATDTRRELSLPFTSVPTGWYTSSHDQGEHLIEMALRAAENNLPN